MWKSIRGERRSCGSPMLLVIATVTLAASAAHAGTFDSSSRPCFTPYDGVYDRRCPLDPNARIFPLHDRTSARGPLFGFDPGTSFLTAGKDSSGGGGAGATPHEWQGPNWLVGRPNYGTWIATGVIAGSGIALGVEGDVEQIENVGDITQILPAVTGLGLALGTKDWKGSKQYVWSGLISTGAVHGLKAANEKYRPDASNTKSFPSGHTQASFFGAGFIMERYGPKWGIPALTLAAYTGYSRVAAQKHFADDVITGMSIALFANWLMVDPAQPERRERKMDNDRPRNNRFELEIADGRVSKNIVQAPAGTGTAIDFEFDEVADPQITASVAFDMVRKERHNIKTRYTPFEIRDVGTVAEDTIFDGVVIPAGTDVYSIYFLGDLRVRYAYEFLPDSRWSVQLGGGLTWIDTTTELFNANIDVAPPVIDEDSGVEVRARGLLPIVYGYFGVDFTKLIRLYLEVDWYDVNVDKFLDTALKLDFQITPRWDVAVGYRYVSDDLELDGLNNSFEREGALIHIAYSF